MGCVYLRRRNSKECLDEIHKDNPANLVGQFKRYAGFVNMEDRTIAKPDAIFGGTCLEQIPLVLIVIRHINGGKQFEAHKWDYLPAMFVSSCEQP